MATLGKTTITDLNVLNNIKENNTSLVDKYTTLGTAQTVSGKKTFSNGLNITGGCTENKNMPFFLGIDAFADGGAVKWIANSDMASAIGAVSKNYSGSQTINGKATTPLTLNNTTDPSTNECGLAFQIGGTYTGWVGAHSSGYTCLYTYPNGRKLGIKNDGTGFIDNSTIITTGNIGSQISGYATQLTLNPTGLSDATYGSYGGIVQTTADNPTGASWTNRIKILHNNSDGYYTELAQSFSGTEGLWHRRMIQGNVTEWKKMLDSTGGNPLTTNTYDLGSSSLKWKNVYATTFNGNLSGNATSASKLGDWITTQYLYKDDNGGNPTLMVISDITPIYNLTSGGGHYGFVGSFIHSRNGGLMREGVGNLIARIGYAWDKRVLTTEDSTIVPCIISYNSKYYIALKLSGSGRAYQLYGYFINKLSEVFELKYTSSTALPSGVTMIEEGIVKTPLDLKGGTMDGDIVMGGVNASQSINSKSKIIWGTGATISSNGNNVIINPTSSTTTGQIIITPGGSPSITVNGTKVSLDGHTHSYIPTSEKVNATGITSTNFGTNGTYVPNMNFLSYWNGAYNSSGTSNLIYCNKGAFGTAATKDTDYFTNKKRVTKNSITSIGWYRLFEFTSYGSYIISISGTYSNANSTAASFIFNKSYDKVNISQIGKASITNMIDQIRVVSSTTTGKVYVDVYNKINFSSPEPLSYTVTAIGDGTYENAFTVYDSPTLITGDVAVIKSIKISTTSDVYDSTCTSYLKGLDEVTNNIDNLGVEDKLSFACYSNSEDTNFPLTGKDGFILTTGWKNNIGYKAQLALDDNGYNVAFRYNATTGWQPWKKLSFEGHTHTASLSGTVSSGVLTISVSVG